MEDRYRRKINHASDDAATKLSFFLHVSAYLAVNSLMIAINLHSVGINDATGGADRFWAKWPIIIWGVILIIHILFVLRSHHQKPGNLGPGMIKKGLRGL